MMAIVISPSDTSEDLWQTPPGWGLIVARKLRQELWGVPAFGIKPTGRSDAILQRLPSATDERSVVPRVYRGLERLASADPGPVPRVGLGSVARIGLSERTLDVVEIPVWITIPCKARGTGPS